MKLIGTETLPSWRSSKSSMTVEILLSDVALFGWDPVSTQIAGFDLRVTMLDPLQDIPETIAEGGQILIVEVRRDSTHSLERLVQMLKLPNAPSIIAALRDPSVADARDLLKAGVADILSLPLHRQELEAALARLRIDLDARSSARGAGGRVVSAIKSVGGGGATALLTQIAAMHAAGEAGSGRETCLLDLDIQFGTAALYLGALPALGINDLIEAGSRIDGAMLRSTMTHHASGLQFIAAPPELLPLEAIDEDQVATVLDIAAREYPTVFVDLPPSWTNWSLSVLARSNLILLVTDLSVAGLHQARRQLDFLRQQELGDMPIRIVANRVERKMFRSIDLSDAAHVLGRPVDYTVAEDWDTMNAALDQGVPVAEINRRSRTTRDIKSIAAGLVEVLAGAA